MNMEEYFDMLQKMAKPKQVSDDESTDNLRGDASQFMGGESHSKE